MNRKTSLSDYVKSGIVQVPLNERQFIKEAHEKKQIVLHHTGSGNNVTGDINWWNKTKERIATCIVIHRNGTIYQVFSSRYWAYHLGTGVSTNNIPWKFKKNGSLYDRHSIGIELDSWGYLTKKGDKYYSYANVEIPEDHVEIYYKPHRGHYYYERYTDAQIESAIQLIQYWRAYYGIPVNYNEDIFDLCTRALEMQPGVYTHNSYVSANLRNDIHPQPTLIKRLEEINE